jgi:hypothetical protein
MKYDSMVSFPVARQRSTAKKERKKSDSIKEGGKKAFRRLTFPFTLKKQQHEREKFTNDPPVDFLRAIINMQNILRAKRE